MDVVLTEAQVRVIGSLIEKEITTPEYYPLTINALINACNQKSNRDPVVAYNECIVSQVIDELLENGLVLKAGIRDSRVPKYDNYFADTFNLKPQEVAVMCELMLRGPQTVGEIRGRADRMYKFAELSEVEVILDGLISREERPLVVKLPRQTGQKEVRYAHLLCGEPLVEVSAELSENLSGACSEIQRIIALEKELEALKQEFANFKKQFE